MNPQFPRGVEVVSGAVMRNDNGMILLTRSPKWAGKWVMPGGHVEPDEIIVQDAQREAEEETGLRLQPAETFDYGEPIGLSEFESPAHFVYFDTVFDIIGGKVTLDGRELPDYYWVMPCDALQLSDPAEGYRKTIMRYCKFMESRILIRNENVASIHQVQTIHLRQGSSAG